MENVFKEKLARARDTKMELIRKAGPEPTRRGIVKTGMNEIKKVATLALLKQIDPLWDWMFGIALMIALLKDLLDLVWIGSLPVIGTAISLAASFCIGLVMFLTKSSGKRRLVKKTIKKISTLALGTLAEMFFGINFLPIETIIVILIFYMTLSDRAETAQEDKRAGNIAMHNDEVRQAA